MLNIPNLQDKNILFPDPNTALKEPNGLLACMGNLHAETLLKAYQKGIFPWYNEQDQPILWWSPNPRSVIYPKEINISHSLKKSIRTKPWEIRIDTEFETVIEYCANLRKNNISVISPNMPDAITIPGAVAGWCLLHKEHGHMPWKELFDPAINFAKK